MIEVSKDKNANGGNKETRRPAKHYDYKTKKQREKEEAYISSQLSEFQRCVVQIRRISWNKVGDLPGVNKKKFISDILCQYYAQEDREDVFEGFLRLLVEFGQSERPNEFYIINLVFEIFHQHMTCIIMDPVEQNFILTKTFRHDTDLFREALALAMNLKVRYFTHVSFIFSLRRQEHSDFVINHIKKMLEKKDWCKAILWIDHFDNRSFFNFEEIVCELYLENRHTLLCTFIGGDQARRHRLIQYFDSLLGFQLSRSDANAQRIARFHANAAQQPRNELSDLETRVVQDMKKVEKTIIKFIRAFNIGLKADQLASNTLTLRCRDCLMYFHHRWTDKMMEDEEHEEVALMAMASNSYVRSCYLNMLTKRGWSRKALYFAVALGIPNNEFPVNLLRYSCESPDELKKVQAEVEAKREKRVILEKAEELLPCELNGIPIVMVDTWEGIQEMLDKLPKETTIGIDAEWKPNFLSTSEMVALLQVALSSVIYLVDVATLEKTLTEPQWLTFFEVLLCSPNRKIGFDFSNDLRVIASSFPFVDVLFPHYTQVICLYRLLVQVAKSPPACKAVFGKEQIEMNLNLSEMTNFFLNYPMDKTEQQGNWLRRPLRMEQKKYAALDAYCLIKIFKIVAERLNGLDDKLLLESLQIAALISNRKSESADEAVVGAELAADDNVEEAGNGVEADNAVEVSPIVEVGVGNVKNDVQNESVQPDNP